MHNLYYSKKSSSYLLPLSACPIAIGFPRRILQRRHLAPIDPSRHAADNGTTFGVHARTAPKFARRTADWIALMRETIAMAAAWRKWERKKGPPS
jgi:hypothetical protein